MSVSVIYKNGAFYAKGMEKFFIPPALEMLKKKGWKFNSKQGWFTTNIKSASLLREHADERAEKIFKRAFIQVSHWKGALSFPNKLTPYPYQLKSALYSLERSRSYLALAPGLGKTIIAAIIASSFGKRVLFVCPPFLVLNTLEEFKKWAPTLHTKILDNVDWIVPDVLIVPDSQITNPYVRNYIRYFSPALFIGDEWHRYKTETAQRSKAIFGYRDNRKKIKYVPGILDGKSLEKVVLMSGTPMPNRPMELFTTLSKCAGEYIDFMTMNQFGLKYCDGFPVKNEYNGKVYGYDFTGCNEDEFRRLMRNVKSHVVIDKKKKDIRVVSDLGFMLRLNKSLIGLPLLTEELVILGEDMPRELKSMDRELLKQFSPKDLLKWSIKKEMGEESDEDIHIMTYRRMLGEYKVKPAADYILSILDDTEENLFVVAYHKEAIKLIAEKLKSYQPIVVTGDTPMKKRHELVKEYQNTGARVILGNLDAIGVGFTLTKADRVLLVEFDWSPGKNRQVIDRVHRIGLNHEVVAQYLVFRNSLDRNTIEILLEKEKITKHV